jgi:peptidoglycan/xylan/chitin deacetylase (PgdA/CDA1 family)
MSIDTHISKTRYLFILGVLVLSFLIVSGSFSFQGSGVLSADNLSREVMYYRYKAQFAVLNQADVKKDVVYTRTQSRTDVIPVLVYHGIVNKPDRFSMTSAVFAEQMSALKKAGYHTITMENLEDFLNGKDTLPEKSFILTFDDGRKDSFYGADPVIHALDFTATMFTATGVSLPEKIEKKSTYYLNPKEIERMHKTGRWDIESHAIQKDGGFITIDAEGTKGNFLSNKMWLVNEGRLETNTEYEARVTNELYDSKAIIEKTLDKTVTAFSYPFGDFGQQSENLPYDYAEKVINKAVSDNYKVAFHQIWPVDHDFSQNHVGESPYLLKRIEPSPFWSGEELLGYVNSGQPKKFPYTETFKNDQGWKNLWGELSVSENRLVTKALPTTAGSVTFLDGTYNWQDYVATSQIDWDSGSHVVLVARYQNADNYASCIISDDNARIEQIVDGTTTRLAEAKIDFIMPKKNVPISFAVLQNSAECFIGNKSLVKATGVSRKIANGGIAFKTWDSARGVASVIVHSVSVNELTNKNTIASLLPQNEIVFTPLPTKPTKPTTKPTPEPKPPIIPVETVSEISLYSPNGAMRPYQVHDFRETSAWKNVWGTYSIEGPLLSIGGTPNTTGGLTILKGTSAWGDYNFMARPESLAGTSFSLVARYTKNNTKESYVSCSFMNYGNVSYVRLDQVTNDETMQIGSSIKLSRYFTSNWKDVPFSIRVIGNEVICTANGTDALRATLSNLTAQGGIGIKTWSEAKGSSNVKIKEIEVTPLQ